MLLGHLKMGSVIVKPGQEILAGDPVAESGNSGYSERPHIHIQLIESNSENYWKGTGIPITFERRNLFKNRIVRIF
jgi:murein DD-endopeptidase MepM/ murein hydrolase activator NlpD